jgi:hypothetical protein
VTGYGIEGLGDHNYYAIHKQDLFRQTENADGSKTGNSEWLRHLSGKTWINLQDLASALLTAQKIWPEQFKNFSEEGIAELHTTAKG